METSRDDFRELRQMQANIHRYIGSLELCWSCERISECHRWLLNDSVPIWLCGPCSCEVDLWLEEQSGVPIALSA